MPPSNCDVVREMPTTLWYATVLPKLRLEFFGPLEPSIHADARPILKREHPQVPQRGRTFSTRQFLQRPCSIRCELTNALHDLHCTGRWACIFRISASL